MFNAMTSISSGPESARRAHLLVYDIPKGTIQNPSDFLWRFGARINLSCWVIPDSRVALLPLKAWQEKGVKVELVRFDERDGDTIIRLAREALVSQCSRWREVLEEATTRVQGECDKVTSVGDDQRKQANKAGGLASFHLRRARKFAVAAVECALGFDLLGDIGKLVDGLNAVIAAKEELFLGMVTEAKKRAESQTEVL